MESSGLYEIIKINVNMMSKLVERVEAYTLALLYEMAKEETSH